MLQEMDFIVKHCDRPPCDCDSCHEATIAADSRRAEIAEIFDRIEWIELLSAIDSGDAPGVLL